MSNLPVDRDENYMYQMWGTTSLTSDYGSLSKKPKMIQEIMHDDIPKNQHHLKESLNYIKKSEIRMTMMIGNMVQNQIMVFLGNNHK